MSQVEVTLEGETFQVYQGYIEDAIAFDDGKIVNIYDIPPNYIHPITLYQLDQAGHKLRNYGDLFDFIEWCLDADHPEEYISGRRLLGQRFKEHVRDYTQARDKENFLARLETSSLTSQGLDTPLIKLSKQTALSSERAGVHPTLEGVVQDKSIFYYDHYGGVRAENYTRILYLYEEEILDLDVPRWQQSVQNWSYNPDDIEFLFLEKEQINDSNVNNTLFLGKELEVCTVYTAPELMAILTKIEPVQMPFFYCKDDQSISGRHSNRIELVTFPMSPRYARANWRVFFDKIAKIAKDNSLEVDDLFDTSPTLNNGIHIHLSRSAFGLKRNGDSTTHMKKFMAAWNMWDKSSQEFYMKIGKRPYLPVNSEYYSIHPDLDGRTLARRLKTTTVTSNRHDSERRHSICHTTSQTLELRIFQGIFDIKHVLTCIDITLASFEYTKVAPISVFNRNFTQRFKDWVYKQPNFKKAKEAMACA